MPSEKQMSRHHRHCMVVCAPYPMAETRVEREAAALTQQDIKVDVICLRNRGEAAAECVDGVQIYRLPVERRWEGTLFSQLVEYLGFFVRALVRLSALHLREPYDVVQIHNLPDFLVFVALLPKLMGAKIILDLHDLMPEFYAERSEHSMDDLPVRVIRFEERISCMFADHLITVTEAWRQTLIGRGQSPQKVSVVMNVADARVFRFEPAIRPRGENFHLVYHGVVGKRHGLDLAVMAVKSIIEDAPALRLTIHGWGEDRERIRNLINELGLHEQVCLTHSGLTVADLVRFLRTADAGIVPYRQGVFTGNILPTKLMEYAALGIPAIVARTPAMAEYFDETMVQFFEPGDAEDLARGILSLYRDRARLAVLAKNIVKFNDIHSWPKVSAAYISVVRSVLGGRTN